LWGIVHYEAEVAESIAYDIRPGKVTLLARLLTFSD
jgi:hypothetical protein